MLRDLGYLADILNASKLILEFVDGMSFDEFHHDEKTKAAVLREFEIVGEAATRVSTPFVVDHPELPWREMVSMRNRVIHGYDDIDFEIVWQAISTSIPELISLIEPLVPPEEEQ